MRKARASQASGAAALIIAGGRGTRFWPASRRRHPKPLFSLDGITTLIGATVARHIPLIERERIFVLVPHEYAKVFASALRGLIPKGNLLVEPAGRGTAVAIAYGAALIRARFGDGLIAVMPADHYVSPPSAFRSTLGGALKLASQSDAVVLIGVTPRRPDSGYGYEKIGRAVGGGFKVERFVEKPNPALARQMVRSGLFLWNAGMFVMESATLKRELEAYCPPLAAAMEQFMKDPASSARLYRRLQFDSFDRVVVEKSANVLSMRARFEWHDVGSWDGLWEAMRQDNSNVLTGNTIAFDSDGVLVRGGDRLIVLLGVKDLVAIDAGDALLIARRSRSQEIRRVTEELERRGLSRYL